MMRRFAQSTGSKTARQGATRLNSEAQGKAAAEAAEDVVARPLLKQKPHTLPEDGTVVFRYGVPIRGKLSKLPLKEKFIICFVFSITGSSAVLVVRPTLRYLVDNGFLGLPEDSGFWNGPWLYRLLYFCVMWPSYSILLLSFGSIFGRRIWFSNMIAKMWGRFLPKRGKEMLRNALDLQ